MSAARDFVADAYEQDGLRTTARRIREGRTPSASSGRLVRVVEVAFAARDIATADFLDSYADAVERGLPFGPNRLRHPEEVRSPLLAALRGLASSFRAGLVD